MKTKFQIGDTILSRLNKTKRIIADIENHDLDSYSYIVKYDNGALSSLLDKYYIEDNFILIKNYNKYWAKLNE